MKTTTNNHPDVPTARLQAAAGELVNELFVRGLRVDDVCGETGVTEAQLWTLLGWAR